MKKILQDNRLFLKAAMVLIPSILLIAWIIANVLIQRSIVPRGSNIYPPSEGLGKIVYIQPVGEIDAETLDFMQAFTINNFQRETRVLDRIIAPYMDGGRKNQLKADFLRQYIVKRRGIPKDTYRLVAVVDDDLYTDGYNFIFGQAELGGMVAVLSIHRLKPMMDGGDLIDDDVCREIYYQRILKLTRHELGHTFGLSHCDNPNCVMSFHSSLTELDEGGDDYCEKCRRLLPDYLFQTDPV